VTSAYEDLLQITEADVSEATRLLAMRSFADKLRWTPSYELNVPVPDASVHDHLIVEHGLAHSAVITFLRGDSQVSDLSNSQIRNLLAISYNNLVDWHVFVSRNDVRTINNLKNWQGEIDSQQVARFSSQSLNELFAPERMFQLRREKLPKQPCDDAIISVVSRWKRLLKADYPDADNHAISTLFNALFFIRGCEDRHLARGLNSSMLLTEVLMESDGESVDIGQVIENAFIRSEVEGDLKRYVNLDALTCFQQLDRATAFDLAVDLYAPKDADYRLNFAILSKHALSRIYERFVSILVIDEYDSQLSFFSSIPIEEQPTRTGAIYTPQFVASFFVRFLREHVTPRQFRRLRTLDPACGSGIFLRSLLELQSNPLDPAMNRQSLDYAFRHATGYDRDPNAIEATKLSLALLHLVATDRLPENLDLHMREAIASISDGHIEKGSFDAVLTNPPYIKLDHLNEDDRDTFKRYLGPDFSGRLDAYLAFTKLCVEALAPGGFACFVLPQVMMTAVNASAVRKLITASCDIRCLIDLSAVRIFEGVGTYSILLIIQKRGPDWMSNKASVGYATDFVGEALQTILDDRESETPYFQIFKVPQSTFREERWLLISPKEISLNARLNELPKLGEYVNWQQGFATGRDKVFIRNKKDVPKDELAVYMDYLPDREIGRFRLPKSVDQVVFYPYLGDEPVSEEQLKIGFPSTWQYLTSHKSELSKSPKATSAWWKPVRPRSPLSMRRPKVVCPHLMLTPRFSVDEKGRFAVKRSPFMSIKDKWQSDGLLHYFCAVLNSSVSSWYIRTYVPSFDRGYSLVETSLLAELPVPNFERIPSSEIRRIIDLASGTVSENDADQLEKLIADLYELNAEDRELLGLQ
jgi:SAM-dependent methyltransferase